MEKERLSNRDIIVMICALAWPTMIEQALQTIVQYADAAMVGSIGPHASAAVGLTSTMTWLTNAPMFAMGIGVLACISRAMGAGDKEYAHTAAVQAVYIAVVLGIVEGILMVGVSPFLPSWLGADEEIHREASIYFAIISLPMLFRTANVIFASVLRSTRDMKTPMLVNLVVNGLNIVLNFLLIYGSRTMVLGGLSIPLWGAGLGVAGAAIATAVSQSVGGVLMFLAFRNCPALGIKGNGYKLDRVIMGQCVRIGFPVALERIFTSLGQVVFTSLVTKLGTISLAAHSIALTAEQAFYIPGFGMQAAASTLAGNAVGEKNEEKLDRVSKWCILMAVGVMTITGGLLFLFPQAMMSIFTRDAAVIAKGTEALRIVALSEPMFAVVIILKGIFNGAGDTKTPFVVSISTMWGIRILFTFISVSILGLGLNSVWICMVADNVSQGIWMGIRFLKGDWKKRVGF